MEDRSATEIAEQQASGPSTDEERKYRYSPSKSYLERKFKEITHRVFSKSDFNLSIVTSDVNRPFIGLEFRKKRDKSDNDSITSSPSSPESIIESHYSGWKFHVSVDIRELKAELGEHGRFLNLDPKLDTLCEAKRAGNQGPLELLLICIRDHFEGEFLNIKLLDFNLMEKNWSGAPHPSRGRLYYGGQITIYIEDQGDYLFNDLRMKISAVFAERKIGFGLTPASDRQLDEYVSLRNDGGKETDYIKAQDLAVGDFNPSKKPISRILETAIHSAEKDKNKFSKNRTLALSDAQDFCTKFTKFQKEQIKSNAEERNETSALQVSIVSDLKHIIKSRETKQLPALIQLFTETYQNCKLSTLKAAFTTVCDKLSSQAKLPSDEALHSLKNEILHARYQYQKNKINIQMRWKFAAKSPLGLAVLPLPFLIYGTYKGRKKRIKALDVQPLKMTVDEYNAMKTLKEAEDYHSNTHLWGSQDLPTKDVLKLLKSSSDIISMRNKFKMGFFYGLNLSPDAKKVTFYLPREKYKQAQTHLDSIRKKKIK